MTVSVTVFNALENGRVAVAREKFGRALYLDDPFAKGYAGLAPITHSFCRGWGRGRSNVGLGNLTRRKAWR